MGGYREYVALYNVPGINAVALQIAVSKIPDIHRTLNKKNWTSTRLEDASQTTHFNAGLITSNWSPNH